MGYFLTLLFLFFSNSYVNAGLHVTVSLMGRLFLIFPAVITFTRYSVAIAQEAGWDPWLAFVFSIFIGMMLGFGIAFMERRLSQDSFAVLGLASIFATIALAKSWTSLTNGVLGISGIQRPQSLETLGGLVVLVAVLGVFILGFEWVLLNTKISRQWRALKESTTILSSIGVNAQQVSSWTIVGTCTVLSMASAPYMWFLQYMDPSRGGVQTLIDGLVVAILVRKPKVSHVLFCTMFVQWTPEVIRFLDLPSAVMGPMRSILYSLVLLVLLLVLQRKILNTNRQI